MTSKSIDWNTVQGLSNCVRSTNYAFIGSCNNHKPVGFLVYFRMISGPCRLRWHWSMVKSFIIFELHQWYCLRWWFISLQWRLGVLPSGVCYYRGGGAGFLLDIGWETYLSIYRSIYLSLYPSIYISNLSIYLSNPFIYLSIYLSIDLSIYPSTYLSIFLIHLSTCLSIYRSIYYLSIDLSIYLSICRAVYLWCSVIQCNVV